MTIWFAKPTSFIYYIGFNRFDVLKTFVAFNSDWLFCNFDNSMTYCFITNVWSYVFFFLLAFDSIIGTVESLRGGACY